MASLKLLLVLVSVVTAELQCNKIPYAANIENHPYQASLQVDGRHFCGGAIISDNFIITSATCLKRCKITSVRVGANYTNHLGHQIAIKNTTKHPEYNSFTGEHDLAVLELDVSLNFSKTISKVLLPTLNSDETTFLNFTGYGVTQDNNIYHKHLQLLRVQSLDFSDCNESYDGKLTEDKLCTKPLDDSTLCQGDYGDPLVYRNVLFGVVSWERQCGNFYRPTVYSKVANDLEFINSVINNFRDDDSTVEPCNVRK